MGLEHPLDTLLLPQVRDWCRAVGGPLTESGVTYREEWQLGAREDWRFTDMRQKLGLLWPLLSFVIVYVAQQVLLVGVTLPFYSIYFPTLSPLPASFSIADLLGLRTLLTPLEGPIALPALPPGPAFNPVWDSLFASLGLAGIVVAYFADTQLYEYMLNNEQRARQGKPKQILLNHGLWYYSR